MPVLHSSSWARVVTILQNQVRSLAWRFDEIKTSIFPDNERESCNKYEKPPDFYEYLSLAITPSRLVEEGTGSFNCEMETFWKLIGKNWHGDDVLVFMNL